MFKVLIMVLTVPFESFHSPLIFIVVQWLENCKNCILVSFLMHFNLKILISINTMKFTNLHLTFDKSSRLKEIYVDWFSWLHVMQGRNATKSVWAMGGVQNISSTNLTAWGIHNFFVDWYLVSGPKLEHTFRGGKCLCIDRMLWRVR